MVENIIYQRVNSLVSSQNGLHLPQFFFAFFNAVRRSP